MILIALVGRKHSGKSTAADTISRLAKGLVYQTAFADALKDEVAQATGVPRVQAEQEKERWRPIWQWWGTEFRRHDDPDYWIRKVGNKIVDTHYHPDVAIVTDCRFDNEAKQIRAWNGLIVKILRPGTTQDRHTSETETDFIHPDFELNNNSDLKGLEYLVRNLCKTLKIELK